MQHSRFKSKSPETFSSDNCISKKHFCYDKITSISTNIDKNEVCTKKFDRIFKKINTHSPSYIKNKHCLRD